MYDPYKYDPPKLPKLLNLDPPKLTQTWDWDLERRRREEMINAGYHATAPGYHGMATAPKYQGMLSPHPGL